MNPASAWEQLVAASPTLAARVGLRRPRFARLQDGAVNEVWLAALDTDRGRDAGRWVLRISRPVFRALGLDRAGELDVLAVVAPAGLGPRVAAALPEEGLLLTEWLPGRSVVPGDLLAGSREGLAGAAMLLRKVHSLSPAGPRADYGAALGRYAAAAGRSHHPRVRAARSRLADLDPGPRVLCHHDPVTGNLIARGADQGMGEGAAPIDWALVDWALVDWEYAGQGSPWFDLAVLASHLGLEESGRQHLLAAYFGAVQLPPDARVTLEAWTAFYEDLAWVWQEAL
jgi:aminoglycoside phosphotransferase (APT) family kinase protein